MSITGGTIRGPLPRTSGTGLDSELSFGLNWAIAFVLREDAFPTLAATTFGSCTDRATIARTSLRLKTYTRSRLCNGTLLRPARTPTSENGRTIAVFDTGSRRIMTAAAVYASSVRSRALEMSSPTVLFDANGLSPPNLTDPPSITPSKVVLDLAST